MTHIVNLRYWPKRLRSGFNLFREANMKNGGTELCLPNKAGNIKGCPICKTENKIILLPTRLGWLQESYLLPEAIVEKRVICELSKP